MGDIAKFATGDRRRARLKAQGRAHPPRQPRPLPGVRPRHRREPQGLLVLVARGRRLRLCHLEVQGRQEPAPSRWRASSSRPGAPSKPVTGFKGRSGKSFRARLALQQNEDGKWRVEFDEPWAEEGAKPPEAEAPEGEETAAVQHPAAAAWRIRPARDALPAGRRAGFASTNPAGASRVSAGRRAGFVVYAAGIAIRDRGEA